MVVAVIGLQLFLNPPVALETEAYPTPLTLRGIFPEIFFLRLTFV